MSDVAGIPPAAPLAMYDINTDQTRFVTQEDVDRLLKACWRLSAENAGLQKQIAAVEKNGSFGVAPHKIGANLRMRLPADYVAALDRDAYVPPIPDGA